MSRGDGLSIVDKLDTILYRGEKETPIGAASLINARRSLAGSTIGGIRETQDVLEFCSKHNIASEIEVVPIQKVNDAYERVVKSDVRYRFVIDMKSL